MSLFYVNVVHGFVRDVKFVISSQKSVFECCECIRTAKPFTSKQEAKYFMEKTCKYKGHYCIVKPVEGMIYE